MTLPSGHVIRVLRGEVSELWVTAIESKAVALDAVEILSGADPSEIKYENEMSASEAASFGLSSGETRRVDLCEASENVVRSGSLRDVLARFSRTFDVFRRKYAQHR